jgi:hypothetical protein
MYNISAHWEIGKRGRPVHAYYVNNEMVGLRARDVMKAVQGPPRTMVDAACVYAKAHGPVELTMGIKGWTSRRG